MRPKSLPTVDAPGPTQIPTARITPTIPPLLSPTTLPPTEGDEQPVFLDATVWIRDPELPVLVYHRFIDDKFERSLGVRLRRSEFRQHLQSLYDSGYSLVDLEDWLNGDLSLPAGRRPLVLTIDDAFFGDQIFLEEDGTPSLKSGLGMLWQFSHEHPDFGFTAALFTNMADKHYGNRYVAPYFLEDKGWENALSKVIVWCLEHHVRIYNHFSHHPRLDLTADNLVSIELRQNDTILRSFLRRVGREDLIPELSNMAALPFGIWPQSRGGKDAIFNYHNPEGKPMQAVLVAGYSYDARFINAPYLPDFDRHNVPRLAGNQASVDLLVKKNQQFPTAQVCTIGPLLVSEVNSSSSLSRSIEDAVKAGRCAAGMYAVGGFVFDAELSPVVQVIIQKPE